MKRIQDEAVTALFIVAALACTVIALWFAEQLIAALFAGGAA